MTAQSFPWHPSKDPLLNCRLGGVSVWIASNCITNTCTITESQPAQLPISQSTGSPLHSHQRYAAPLGLLAHAAEALANPKYRTFAHTWPPLNPKRQGHTTWILPSQQAKFSERASERDEVRLSCGTRARFKHQSERFQRPSWHIRELHGWASWPAFCPSAVHRMSRTEDVSETHAKIGRSYVWYVGFGFWHYLGAAI